MRVPTAPAGVSTTDTARRTSLSGAPGFKIEPQLRTPDPNLWAQSVDGRHALLEHGLEFGRQVFGTVAAT